ncbi:acyltransferase [Arachidicoccus sp.]|uniref:acyltransferase n=1 Tax=Arachidicoccus sp. TaxID=1872624 RepID=UPI003D1BA3C1
MYNSFFKRAYFLCIRVKGLVFYFIFPNIFRLSKIQVRKLPKCEQKTKITGQGKVVIGENCSFGYKLGGFHRKGSVELQARYKNSIIQLGNKIATNNNIFICAANLISIGDRTLIGQNVTLMDFEAHGINPDERWKVGEIGKIIIEENVWIGNNVIILKNSKIGKNSIVAAGAIVNGEFPDDVIIGGVPARIIKKIGSVI